MDARADLVGICIVGLGVVSLFFAPVAAEAQVFLGPTISGITDVRMPEETLTNVSFTVTDPDGLVTNVSATIPANPGLAKISGTLSGSNVTMTIRRKYDCHRDCGPNLVSAHHGFRLWCGTHVVDHTADLSVRHQYYYSDCHGSG